MFFMPKAAIRLILSRKKISLIESQEPKPRHTLTTRHYGSGTSKEEESLVNSKDQAEAEI
jgi:hypothetical protein